MVRAGLYGIGFGGVDSGVVKTIDEARCQPVVVRDEVGWGRHRRVGTKESWGP